MYWYTVDAGCGTAVTNPDDCYMMLDPLSLFW